MKNVLLISLLVLTFAACKSSSKAAVDATTASTDESVSLNWLSGISMDEAIQQAAISDKPIFIDVSTSWCGYCKKMKKKVYTKDNVSTQLASNYIPVKVDAEVGEGIKIAQQFGVTGYPTQLILSKDGKLLSKNVGYLESDQLLKFIR